MSPSQSPQESLAPWETPSRLPRVVLLDLGGVVLALRPIEEAFAVHELAAREGIGTVALREAIESIRRSDVFARYETGRATSDEFFNTLAQIIPGRSGRATLERRFLSVVGDEMPGMLELIEELKSRGVRVAALSDTSPLHLAEARRRPAVQAIETVIASCETGRRKPDVDTFRDALERLAVPATDVYYTDDVERNVFGARAAGIRADLFRGTIALRRSLGLAGGTAEMAFETPPK